jgi:hypothetical protein
MIVEASHAYGLQRDEAEAVLAVLGGRHLLVLTAAEAPEVVHGEPAGDSALERRIRERDRAIESK